MSRNTYNMKLKKDKVEDSDGIVITGTKTMDFDGDLKKDPLSPNFTIENKDEEENKTPPAVPFFSLFRYSTTLEKITMGIGFVAAAVMALAGPANIFLFGTFSGDMINFAGASNSSINLLDSIYVFSVGNSCIGAITFVATYISNYCFNYVAQKQIFRIRSLFLQSALHQDITWYDLNKSGEFTSRMSEDLNKLEDGIGEKIAMFTNSLVAFLACMILAFVRGWELTLICLVSLPVTLISFGMVGWCTSNLAKKELDAYGKAGSIAEEVLSAMRTVVAFGGQAKEVERYKTNLVDAKNINIRKSLFTGLGMGLLWFFIYACYALAFWYGVGLYLDERHLPADQITYDAGNMIMVFFSVMMGSMNLSMGSPYVEAFGIAKGAGAKVFSVIDRKSEINSMSEEGKKPTNIKGDITFENIHFHYPSRPEVKILQGLSLTINAGQTVALVGNSGCGKSTCVQLIQRFYDPLEGQVKLDGNDLQELNVAWLRSNIGVVGQEPVLFQTTIAENIRYGNQNASLEEIIEAAKQANAHDFISKLPQGYETLVGDRGAQLSGGQKQRVAIARALVRKPHILLLDEATSALDTGSEAKVQAALDKASKGRTTIIVAHRLSTIRRADKIVVISNGKVVEQGTHDELMALVGHYHTLVTAQITSGPDDDDVNTPVENKEKTKLNRMLSIMSNGSSVAGESLHENEDEIVEKIDEEEEKNPSTMMEVMKYNKKEWPIILIGSICSVIMGCAMPVFAVLFGDILQSMASDSDAKVREDTDFFSLLFLITGIITGIAVFCQIYTFGVAGEKLTMRLRGLLFEALMRQEIAYYDDKAHSPGALCSRLSDDASKVQGATGQRIGTVLQSIATIVLAITLSMYYEWRLGLVALAFTPVCVLAQYFFGVLHFGQALNNAKAMEKSTKLAVEAVGNIRTVAGLGVERMFHLEYITNLLHPHKLALRNAHVRGLVYALALSIMYFAFAACMYYGGQLVVNEGLSIGDVFKVSQALIFGTMTIGQALAFAPNFQKGLQAAGKIFELLERKPKVTDPPIGGKDDWSSNGNVSYANVEFSYPTRETSRVLRGLNLMVKQGQTVALVGPSGCGKSTCIQLLERFYDPTSGIVALDGRDISSVTLHTLRIQMGIVSQEPILFDRTIAQNIAYGDNSRDVKMDEIIEAAKQANIHNFITSLPLGYDTSLGEKGTQLSGGQKQRVAIARALVRNPRILLLDEATSALDNESEKIVQAALDKAKEGRTCITIAHRLSTIHDADVICVIDKGRVAELGKHSELLSQRGIYYKLHSLQGGH